jgi:sarcosine oxidase
MATDSYDVIILGLGAMGSAAAYHLAKAGRRVLGLDRFKPPHALGSSHGQTRIIREAYFEHPAYVPIVQRAYELWTELEEWTGRQFLKITGGLMIGPPDGVVFSGAMRSAKMHDLAYEVLTGAEVTERFPALTPGEDVAAVWEPRAGILFPEKCIEVHLGLAAEEGAALHFEEPVGSWKVEGNGVSVVTSKGRYSAGQLLCCAGAWTKAVLGLDLPLQVERQVQFWFEPWRNAAFFQPKRCPIYIWEFDYGRFFYGFPDLGEGVKVAGHHEGPRSDPDQLDRDVKPSEVQRMREIICLRLPEANGRLRSTAVCMYTNTPDSHFLIDWHPEYPQVLIASPCSGHGFKFSSAIGEVLSDLLVSGEARFDLSLFSLKRWK